MSDELIKKIEEDLDKTLGRFKSVMPRALQGVIEEHMYLDDELSENEEEIKNVKAYLENELIWSLWDTIGDVIGDISHEAKREYQLGDFRPSKEDMEFSNKEQEIRDEGL
ncbi:MAG: hypothetical protein NZ824_04715 [Candidatus Thioglobus sp.]|nr:hypothetical protein [Candidatus Thioglobus sp.]